MYMEVNQHVEIETLTSYVYVVSDKINVGIKLNTESSADYYKEYLISSSSWLYKLKHY